MIEKLPTTGRPETQPTTNTVGPLTRPDDGGSAARGQAALDEAMRPTQGPPTDYRPGPSRPGLGQ
jgi:hypothetical protein